MHQYFKNLPVGRVYRLFLIRQRKRILSMLAFLLLLSACDGTTTPDPMQDINVVLTSGVQTLVASYFQTQTALWTPIVESTATVEIVATDTLIPTSTPIISTPVTNPIPLYTNTPSLTPLPTGTYYTSTPNPSTLAYGCNNLGFIRDGNVSSGTVFKPGETFTKSWKVVNTGTCTWMYKYKLVYVSGDSMGAEPRGLGKMIDVNQWTELSVSMVAPKDPGTYTAYWRLGDQDGHAFGSTLTVSIKVERPAPDTPVPTDTQSSYPNP